MSEPKEQSVLEWWKEFFSAFPWRNKVKSSEVTKEEMLELMIEFEFYLKQERGQEKRIGIVNALRRLIVERGEWGEWKKKMEEWKDTADILIKASPSIFISQRCLDLAYSIRDSGKEGK